jgi:hypothetical protein
MKKISTVMAKKVEKNGFRTRDEARRTEPQELSIRRQPTRRANGGDSGQLNQHVSPARVDPQLYLTQLLMNLPQARMSVSPRYLCESFPECLGPCHGGTWSAPACFFPHVIGLPPYAIEVGLTRVNPVKTIS